MRVFRRAAAIRSFVGVFAGFLGVFCNFREARADETVRTIEAPSPPHRFGDAGDVVIPLFGAGGGVGALGAMGNGFGVGVTDENDREGQTKTAEIFATPSFDVFVAEHLSLGASATVGYFRYVDDSAVPATGNGQLEIGFHPRIGYAIALGEHTTFWPRLAVGVTGNTNIGADSSFYSSGPVLTVDVIVDAPFVYSIDRHVYFSLGPAANASTTFGGYNAAGFGTFASAGFVL